MLERIFSPVFLRRARKFRRLKRGYYAFLLIIGLYVLSFGVELLMNNTALYVRYQGKSYFPIFEGFHKAKDFGMRGYGPPSYRKLKELYAKDGQGNEVIMPLYPYGPDEDLLDELSDRPPTRPDRIHWLGTDDRGRDVLVRLAYGFRLSMSFGLLVTFFSYILGISIGAVCGYYGGRIDITTQRFIEIWSTLPFLYTVMILSSFLQPSFKLLAAILSVFEWMGLSYYVRGEFYREKARDYVSAAIAIGQSDRTIIFRHILPNSLTPVISFAPFAILGNITALVSLDFLGFGLPPPTASWGELLHQALGNLTSPWLTFSAMGALFCTLLLVAFVGEAAREAFDPKEYSRLR